MEKLGIDASLLIAQVINFIIILAIYAKWVHKPFMQKLTDEHQKQIDLEKALSTAQNKEAVMLEREKKLRSEMDSKLKKEYAAMKKEVDDAKREIIAQAHTQAEEIREHNTELLESEREKMMADVRKETYDIAQAVLSKALHDVVDESMQQTVTKQVVAKLPKIKIA